MARPNRPWFRKTHGEWHVTLNGKKIGLKIYGEENGEAADAAFEQLRERMVPSSAVGTIRQVVPAFLASIAHKVKPATLASYTRRAAWLVARFGGRGLRDVDPCEVERAAASEAWSDGTRRLTLTVAQMVVRHGGRKDFDLDRPANPARGPECVLTADEVAAVLAECRGDFGPLVRFLFLTGCRPGEGRTLTAESVQWQAGTVRVTDHKTAGKTGRPRILYLSPAALAVLAEQRALYGSGLLFRGVHGQEMTPAAVQWRLRRVREKLGLRSAVVPYAMRHSFATRALEAGISDVDVAAMLGHTGTAMLHKNYSHVHQNSRRLVEVASRLGEGHVPTSSG